MTDPYRDSALDIPAEAPRDPGIVGDVIAQFADAKAFFRELVQNSIDAGTPTVEIELRYDNSAQRMHASVRDRGEGMTRDVIENQLLVLFRSTKETDRSKIGKFGIGFVSVLSPDPEVVAVQTSRDGRRLAMHLYRDLSYELFDAGPATQTGTTVELEIAVPREEAVKFVEDSVRSLVRWCRHASVPIELAVRLPEDIQTVRIDRPLAIENALVEVKRTTDDGQLTAVVALAAQPYLGFFNHGLMLFETPQPLIKGLAVKIQDARLGHTISRDDVRRDQHYERAIAFARDVARDDLVKAVVSAVHAAAEAHDLARHRQLLTAIAASDSSIDRGELHVPIVELIGGKRSVRSSELGVPVWTSQGRSVLTAALAAEGTPVVLLPTGDPSVGLYSSSERPVESELTCITPIDTTDADDALVALLDEIFDAAHRRPEAIVLATLVGARADRLAISAKYAERPHVVDRDEAARDPFTLLRRRVLVLSVEHPQVAAARACDPVVAASHLARAVLLQHRLLDESRSRAIVDHALARVGVAR